MDPVEKLPAEITVEIFAMLDANTLLIASLASRSWRTRILDSELWKRLYKDQGWGFDRAEISSYQQAHAKLSRQESQRPRTHDRTSDHEFGQPQQKKRAIAREQNDEMRMRDVDQWREQHGIIEADVDLPDADPIEGQLPNPGTVSTSPRSLKRLGQTLEDDNQISFARGRHDYHDSRKNLVSQIRPDLFNSRHFDIEKFSWSSMYKQRRRLEKNWVRGEYTNFTLPHPQHPEEAHKECVYTIQFYGKWLVSGSRDKTLRIWDMDTRRLRGKPLVGHTQSVLCLQFDPTEGEDVVISGSSDTSVIIWRFSTGQKIHEIQQAHRESVLNLRFDSRYLVTCSKDKLIKIWNRQFLLPTDDAYPRMNPASGARMASYIIDTSAIEPSLLEAKIANRQIKALEPYRLLMVIEGHSAAVNAIQIEGDKIVSASGDRFVKLWNVRDGCHLKDLQGHQKGIACVQFDGKRVVSGSSDNTVRIYDYESAGQIAVLNGHHNLVRTVQAGFGDMPGSDQAYFNDARAADEAFANQAFVDSAAQGDGDAESSHAPARRPRNDHQRHSHVLNAALPPGGGGSQWGRIVSGSYDETIIVWKKDHQGNWVVGHTLRQEAALRASSQADMQAYHNSRIPAGGAPASSLNRPQNWAPPQTAPALVQAVRQTSMAVLQTGIQNVMNIGNTLNNNPATSGGAPTSNRPLNWLPASAFAPILNNVNTNGNVHQTSGLGNTSNNSHAINPAPTAANPNMHHNNHNPAPPLPQPVPQPVPHPAYHPHQLNNQQQQQAAPSRVFKLQFDARRIVCCSQDPRIVGWDFANGDPEIEAACRFFVGP